MRRRSGRLALADQLHHRFPSARCPHCPLPLLHHRCSLQDAYLEALDKCGGLHEARPKTLLDMLLPRFPYLTLQVNMHRSMTGGALRIGARVEHRPGE